MSLDQEIEARRAEIRSDGYPMSIGELISIYRDDELDIHPEFQRFFRWSDEQKSRLIESILLGIPLPSIFVSQRDDGVWDCDRRSAKALYHLRVSWCPQRTKMAKELPSLTLRKTKYLPSMEGKKWEDDESGTAFIGNANRLIITALRRSTSR